MPLLKVCTDSKGDAGGPAGASASRLPKPNAVPASKPLPPSKLGANGKPKSALVAGTDKVNIACSVVGN
jgi:hypothetical protein